MRSARKYPSSHPHWASWDRKDLQRPQHRQWTPRIIAQERCKVTECLRWKRYWRGEIDDKNICPKASQPSKRNDQDNNLRRSRQSNRRSSASSENDYVQLLRYNQICAQLQLILQDHRAHPKSMRNLEVQQVEGRGSGNEPQQSDAGITGKDLWKSIKIFAIHSGWGHEASYQQPASLSLRNQR